MINLKKSKKNNVKGFVLAETLITTVFVASILSIIFINFYPLIGEYDKREAYDDVDSKYAAFWVKKILQDDKNNTCFNTLDSSKPIVQIDDSCLTGDFKLIYQNFKSTAGIENVYVSYYSLVSEDESMPWNVKDYVKSNSFSSEFKDYIAYLPKYVNFESYDKTAIYRVYVEINHTGIKDGVGDETHDYKTFSTMEVSR